MTGNQILQIRPRVEILRFVGIHLLVCQSNFRTISCNLTRYILEANTGALGSLISENGKI